MQNAWSQEETLRIAETVLKHTFGNRLQLEFLEDAHYPDMPNAILRCQVRDAPDGSPDHLIIKRRITPPHNMIRELAGYDFVMRHSDLAALFPRYYGGDQTSATIIIEDLGSDRSRILGNILQSEDTDSALEALRSFQKTLAAMHLASLGKHSEFTRIAESYGNAAITRHRIHSIAEALRAVPELISQFGIRNQPELPDEIDEVCAALNQPGPFLTFTHGDSTPANFYVAPNRPRLFDLETCGFRHALLDGVFARIRYLHSVWAHALPLHIQQMLADVYRSELRRGIPAVADDRNYQQAYTACAAGWLAGLLQFLAQVDRSDRVWGLSTIRQRIIAGLESFCSISEETGNYPMFAITARALAARLYSLWPENDCRLPMYRAFGGPS